MRKEIKKWGESAVIVLTKEELKVYSLKVGDVIELEVSKSKKEVKNGVIQKKEER